ncbi:flagellar filament capping protein FliD [Polymorphobacter fuscus]|nr:flagellar filament capping protein FliD [Polymorphobacter fuscus]NJC07875.1 flagellar hook-associated protein 2 [Polymorphobacter fuscus]
MASIVSTLGAGSGIDTKALIETLVTADREARTKPLTARKEALTARISALGQVQSSLQGIATSLAARVAGGALGLIPVSSDAAVAVERRGTGPATAFDTSVSVTALAAGQRLVAAPLASAAEPVGEGVLTIGFGRRTDLGGGAFSFSAGSAPAVDIAITAANNSLAGLRDAINAAGAGVTATIISNAGAATLAIKGADGADNGFVISVAEAPGAPGLARFASTPGDPAMAMTAVATDAAFSVDGIGVTRGSNVIDDLIPGVRLRLTRPAAEVTLRAARNSDALATTVSDFASTLSAMRGLVADYRKGATGADPAGALAGDATARAIDARLAGLVATPIAAANGLRLRDLGVSVTRTGEITFDEARLAALPAARQGDAEALMRTLSGSSFGSPHSLQAIAALVTPASAGLARRRDALTADLARVEVRLAQYRETLTRQYAAMDRLVAASKAVGTQLDTQIKMWTASRG